MTRNQLRKEKWKDKFSERAQQGGRYCLGRRAGALRIQMRGGDRV